VKPRDVDSQKSVTLNMLGGVPIIATDYSPPVIAERRA
jgi:hypothetical protein